MLRENNQMTPTQQAIEAAIRANYNPWKMTVMPQPAFLEKIDFDTILVYDGDPKFSEERGRIFISSTLLDPLFWQALAKEMGWNTTLCVHCGSIIKYGEDTKSAIIHCDHKNIKDLERKWLNRWHSFIDTLAAGRTPDDFFAGIIKDKN